ncbi:unnamed protein product [Callosobruchus maculatus]|uniref:Uncharacterized protein n=1 Tax=Callosobruchus maculatus TaxID=64391 RepID=A0A653D1D1_CALMS|nr:unnamed protein product [Callosobruchus maculatus]
MGSQCACKDLIALCVGKTVNSSSRISKCGVPCAKRRKYVFLAAKKPASSTPTHPFGSSKPNQSSTPKEKG